MPYPHRQQAPGRLGHLLLRGPVATLEERRCAVSTCRCVLARDNPERICSPCMQRVSRMPRLFADYLEGD
jgi:hypothetical protein